MKVIFFFWAIICAYYVRLSNEDKIFTKQKTLSDSTVYSNKLYKMVLFRTGGKVNRFKIYNLKNSTEFTGWPELITIDGEVPEGTNRIDYNNPNDQMGYACDSTYHYSSNRFEVVFAVEKATKRRLDLILHNSKDTNFRDGDHTLIKK